LGVINQVVVGITALVRDCLRISLHRPIRAIPDRHHECPQVEDLAVVSRTWRMGFVAPAL